MRGKQATDAFGFEIFDKTTGKATIQLENRVEFWVNADKIDFTKYLRRPLK